MEFIGGLLYEECCKPDPDVGKVKDLVRRFRAKDEFSGSDLLMNLKSFGCEDLIGEKLYFLKGRATDSNEELRIHRQKYLDILINQYALDTNEDPYDSYTVSALGESECFVSEKIWESLEVKTAQYFLEDRLEENLSLFLEYRYKIENRYTAAFIRLFRIIWEYRLLNLSREDLIDFLNFLSYNVNSPHFVELYKLLFDCIDEDIKLSKDGKEGSVLLFSRGNKTDDDFCEDWRKEILEILGAEESYSFCCEDDAIKSITCYILYELVLAYKENKDYRSVFHVADAIGKTPKRVTFYREKEYGKQDGVFNEQEVSLMLSVNDRVYFEYEVGDRMYMNSCRDMIYTALNDEINYSEDQDFEPVDLTKYIAQKQNNAIKNISHQIQTVYKEERGCVSSLKTEILFENGFKIKLLDRRNYEWIKESYSLN